MSSLTALWNRTFAVLGRVSMYRLVVFALVALAVIAFVLSFFGVLAPSPIELVAAWAALAASCVATDAVAHRLLGKAWRWESSLTVIVLGPPYLPLRALISSSSSRKVGRSLENSTLRPNSIAT